MGVSIRVCGLCTLLIWPGVAAFAQHRGGGAPHSAMGAGHYGATSFGPHGATSFGPHGATSFGPRLPVYPSASANSIGIPASAYSIGFPAPSYGAVSPAYPSYSHPYGSSHYSGAGPWRSAGYGKNGYRSRYGYAGLPYFPLLGYYDNGFYDAPPPYPPTYGDDPSLEGGPAPDVAGLSEQVKQLSAQLNDLQNQLSQRSPSASGSVPEDTQQSTPEPPLTVVLHNGQTLQIQNYAVMGDTLWDLSSEPSHRIPVSSIDIPASTKASEASGAEFPQLVPKPRS
jgi:hypothetical protein